MGQPNSGPTSKELGKAARRRRAGLAGAHQERMARECQARERLAEPAGESPAGLARESPARLARERQARLAGARQARLAR